MKPLSPDTTPEAQEKQIELLRQMPTWEKFKLIFKLVQAEREQMQADLHRRFPQASEEELRRRLIAQLLTRDEVIRAYGFDPEEEGYSEPGNKRR
jgi:hypothetical protein